MKISTQSGYLFTRNHLNTQIMPSVISKLRFGSESTARKILDGHERFVVLLAEGLNPGEDYRKHLKPHQMGRLHEAADFAEEVQACVASRGAGWDKLADHAESAIEGLNKSIEAHPLPRAFLLRGYAYTYLDYLKRARKDFREALNLIPVLAPGFNRQQYVNQLCALDKAIYRRAAELFDDWSKRDMTPEGYFNRGFCRILVGDPEMLKQGLGDIAAVINRSKQAVDPDETVFRKAKILKGENKLGVNG